MYSTYCTANSFVSAIDSILAILCRPEDDVFLSANRLINHTNALLGTYKALGY